MKKSSSPHNLACKISTNFAKAPKILLSYNSLTTTFCSPMGKVKRKVSAFYPIRSSGASYLRFWEDVVTNSHFSPFVILNED